VVARIVAHQVEIGDELHVRLVTANPEQPPAAFQRTG
jgi:hypothetical protein